MAKNQKPTCVNTVPHDNLSAMRIKKKVAGPLGFEPRTSGSAGQCHNPY